MQMLTLKFQAGGSHIPLMGQFEPTLNHVYFWTEAEAEEHFYKMLGHHGTGCKAHMHLVSRCI